MLKPLNFLSLVMIICFSAHGQNLSVDRVEELLQLERFHVFNLGPGINSKFSEYNPVLDPDGRYVLYTSRSDTATGQNIYSEDRQFFEDINLAKEQGGGFEGVGDSDDPLGDFAQNVNSKKHEAPVYISEGSETIILFKDNDLWYSNRTDDGYTEPVRYPKNINFKYYHRHASLTADGKRMYFTAEVLDKKTERFHLDLFTTYKNEKGEWQKPEALPMPVNTLYNEDSPEISADGSMLFFSSNRTDGKRGYDIYYVNLTTDSLELTRLQGPINSPANDIYFKMLPDGRSAYFSSNRLGGFGAMDIYKVTFYQLDDQDCTMGLMDQTELLINGSDTVVSGSRLLMNARGSVVSGETPTFYDWYLNDSLIGIGERLNFAIDSVGTHELKLFAASVDSTFMTFAYTCKMKSITVLGSESFVEASQKGPKVPSEDQLISAQELMDLLPLPIGDIILANDVVSTFADVPVMLSLFDNDPGSKSGKLALTSLTRPKYGTVMISDAQKGTVLYYPSSSFVGNDAFGYSVKNEDGKEATAYAAIRVLVNPYFNVGDSGIDQSSSEPKGPTTIDYALTRAGRLVAINVFLNDDFPEASQPKLVGISKAQHGAGQIYDAEEGTILYAPNGSYQGEDEFSYTVELIDGKRETGQVKVSIGEREKAVVAATTPQTEDDEMAMVSESEKNKSAKKPDTEKDVSSEPQSDVVELSGVDQRDIDKTDKPDLDLETIYFNFDEDRIRSDAREAMASNIETLKNHPKVIIQVVSHCDSWGSSAYNQLLSARRAKSTVDYLVSNGIDKDRIMAAVGYGEEQLVNDCGDGVPCPKSKHQANRRSEFVIVGSKK